MKVHRDDVIRPGHAEHVGHQLGGDGGSGLVLLVLSGVGETGYHGSYLKQAASVEHLLCIIINKPCVSLGSCSDQKAVKS